MTLTAPARERNSWRAVALPAEHGGWSLTLEPAVLGLVIAPSLAGVAITFAALLAFTARTPLKLVAGDVWRGRRLARTRYAAIAAGIELAALAILSAAAVWAAGPQWLIPVAIAAPLMLVELWFDMRARGRRLVPELCGSAGMGAVAAAVVLAGDESASLGDALWLLIAARAVASIPFVRAQIDRLRHGTSSTSAFAVAHAIAVVMAALAVVIEPAVAAGAIVVALIVVLQLFWARQRPVLPKVLGLRQLSLGLTLVAVTAAGVIAA